METTQNPSSPSSSSCSSFSRQQQCKGNGMCLRVNPVREKRTGISEMLSDAQMSERWPEYLTSGCCTPVPCPNYTLCERVEREFVLKQTDLCADCSYHQRQTITDTFKIGVVCRRCGGSATSIKFGNCYHNICKQCVSSVCQRKHDACSRCSKIQEVATFQDCGGNICASCIDFVCTVHCCYCDRRAGRRLLIKYSRAKLSMLVKFKQCSHIVCASCIRAFVGPPGVECPRCFMK